MSRDPMTPPPRMTGHLPSEAGEENEKPARIRMPCSESARDQSPAAWRQEARHLGRSGTILAVNQLAQLAIPFVTVTMTGQLGVAPLAAGGVVGSIGLLLFITALGVMQGLIPQLSASLGAKDLRAAARTVRGGLVIAVAMGLGATVIMAGVPWCLARAGQDPAVLAEARRFIHALLPGYLPGIVAIALRFFLIAANDLRWLNAIIIAGTAFNLASNLFLAGGRFGLDGMTAIGITIAMTNWLMLGLLMTAAARSRHVPPGVLNRHTGLAMREALRLGIPVGAIFFTETLLFTGSSVLMGTFGKAALAAHGIVLLWLNIALMIPIGISQAAMARVAALMGQRDFATLRQAVLVSLVIGFALSIAIGIVLMIGSSGLVLLTLGTNSAADQEVITAARGFFRLCAITQLLSGLVIVMASILRGLRDTNSVLWFVMLIYWGAGLGGAILFAFPFGLGGIGIWLGITLAFVFAVILLAVRFVRAISRLTQPAGTSPGAAVPLS